MTARAINSGFILMWGFEEVVVVVVIGVALVTHEEQRAFTSCERHEIDAARAPTTLATDRLPMMPPPRPAPH